MTVNNNLIVAIDGCYNEAHSWTVHWPMVPLQYCTFADLEHPFFAPSSYYECKTFDCSLLMTWTSRPNFLHYTFCFTMNSELAYIRHFINFWIVFGLFWHHWINANFNVEACEKENMKVDMEWALKLESKACFSSILFLYCLLCLNLLGHFPLIFL